MYENDYIHRDTNAKMLKETSAGFFKVDEEAERQSDRNRQSQMKSH